MSIDFEYLGLREQPPRLIDYQWAWDHQREVHARVATGEIPGRVMLLEHEAVYTAGHQTLPEERPFDGTPVIDVDRGGKITWHGPGQLVGYPIMLLPDRVGVVDHVRRVEQAVIELLAGYGIQAGRVPGRTGVWLPADDPDFLPPIETGSHHAKSVARTGYFTPGTVGGAPGAVAGGGITLASVDGQAPAVGHRDAGRSAGGRVSDSLQSRSMGVVPPLGDAERSRRDPSLRGSSDAARSAGGLRGVVLPPGALRPERKICAIGIRVTKRTTMHGFALNISNGSQGFDNIIPCGIPDAGVTSMAAELGGSAPSVLEVAERLEPLLAAHLSREGNLTR